jgi:hypothetical protein
MEKKSYVYYYDDDDDDLISQKSPTQPDPNLYSKITLPNNKPLSEFYFRNRNFWIQISIEKRL